MSLKIGLSQTLHEAFPNEVLVVPNPDNYTPKVDITLVMLKDFVPWYERHPRSLHPTLVRDVAEAKEVIDRLRSI